ncbi:MAG: hypothetical protein HY803_05170 [candidate division NC10 bacterium]|nr:hypothetical protein [candidate division NC10 bacterium]
MRHFILAAVCLGLLGSCGGLEPRRRMPQEFRRLEADFDQTWEAAIRTLTERGYDIRTIDRPAGIIETGWLTINSDYAATVLVTEREDRYSTCGKPGLGQAFRAKEARLVLALRPIRRGETGLRIEAFFRTQRYSDAPLWGNRPLGDAECSSRGRLEEELKVEVQLRALSDQLERLRRGTP